MLQESKGTDLKTRDIIIKWLDEVSKSELGDELFLPCEDREIQTEVLLSLRREIKILSDIDPIKAAQMKVKRLWKDGKLWVLLKKIPQSPLIAFKKNKNGEVKRVNIEDTAQKKRRWKLMKQDGYSAEDIIKHEEDSLTKEDLIFLKGGNNDTLYKHNKNCNA